MHCSVSTFDEQTPPVRLVSQDAKDEAGTVEIQRLLAWYFREDPPRHIAGTRDLRDAA